MASWTITIPDNRLDRVRHALCKANGLIDSNANAKGVVVKFIKDIVRQVETIEAQESAIDAVLPPNTDDVAS